MTVGRITLTADGRMNYILMAFCPFLTADLFL
jgi:hypothetical protein